MRGPGVQSSFRNHLGCSLGVTCESSLNAAAERKGHGHPTSPTPPSCLTLQTGKVKFPKWGDIKSSRSHGCSEAGTQGLGSWIVGTSAGVSETPLVPCPSVRPFLLDTDVPCPPSPTLPSGLFILFPACRRGCREECPAGQQGLTKLLVHCAAYKTSSPGPAERSSVRQGTQLALHPLSTKHRAQPWVLRAFRPGPGGIGCGWLSPELLSDGRQLLCLPEHPWGKPIRLSQGDTLGSGSHLF